MDKLNKGATDGIKGAVKAKVISSKYSTICIAKLKDMFWKAAPIKSAKWLGLPQFPWGIGLSASIDVKLFGWLKNKKGQMATVMQKEMSLRLTVTLHKKEGKYH